MAEGGPAAGKSGGYASVAKPERTFNQNELARCIFAFKTRVDANVTKGSIPPPDVLVFYMQSQVVASIRACAAGSPPETKATLIETFATAGWDINSNQPTNKALVTVENVQKCLTELTEAFPRAVRPAPAVAVAEAAVKVDTKPTSEELGNLGKACERLWDLDVARLVPGDEYVLDLQRGKKPYHKGDHAPNALFTTVDESIFKENETFHWFRCLLDNYSIETGVAERVSRTEKAEEGKFIEAAIKTPVMQYVFEYLQAKEKVRDMKDFKAKLADMWFKLYSRDTRNDTCGFEHVFVGEVDEGVLKGMHNWIQLYIEEKAGHLDYLGYILPRRQYDPRDPFENAHLITLQFSWHGTTKPVSTSFVGVSPEYEFALYSLCFLMGKKKQRMMVEDDEINITVYDMARKIGTAYPELPND